MNKIFAEATTGVAFVLTLSKRQCNTLLRLLAHSQPGKRHQSLLQGPANINLVQVDNLKPLALRGLVAWDDKGFKGLTKAGELAAQMLLEAGMTIEGTNTLSVLKRIHREEAA